MRDALGLLTTFGRRGHGGAITAASLRWFPAVGAVLGAVVGGAWWAAGRAWPRPVAAALVLAANAACTGLLHYDGLVDAADGLLPHADRARRLDIMRTPEAGAFGVTAVAIVVALQAAALASQRPSIVLAITLFATTRAAAAAVPAIVPYARAEGMASALVPGASVLPLVAALPAGLLAALAGGIAGATAIVAALAGAAAVVVIAWRRVGGFTGDVLGAAIVVGETAGFIVAAARW
jgi:adenosylcobinamide-GDP ribazoletransferase